MKTQLKSHWRMFLRNRKTNPARALKDLQICIDILLQMIQNQYKGVVYHIRSQNRLFDKNKAVSELIYQGEIEPEIIGETK